LLSWCGFIDLWAKYSSIIYTTNNIKKPFLFDGSKKVAVYDAIEISWRSFFKLYFKIIDKDISLQSQNKGRLWQQC
jgi:hypothetical protein